MSVFVHGEPRIQEVIDAARGTIQKCRIPQRLPPGRQKPFVSKLKPGNNIESVTHQKLANRGKDELPVLGKLMHTLVTRSARPEREKLQPAPRRPSTIPKRVTNEVSPASTNKSGRPIITVPMVQRQTLKMPPIKATGLPTQDKIIKCENLELQQSELASATYTQNYLNDIESITFRSDNVMEYKIRWQDMLIQFENMNAELKDRQEAIMQLYASMHNVQQRMIKMGQKVTLPLAEDLHIMNVAKLTPEQLLQLCAGGEPRNHDEKGRDDSQLKICDLNKLYNMPTKLVATCQHTLMKRKEIIDWFESLKSQAKGVSTKILSEKVHEFNAENEMMQCSLDQVKTEFLKELNDIVECLRKSVNETVALQLRTEELTYKLSELDTQNSDLKKQIHNVSQIRSQSNKGRIEELEKELKEEKCKKVVIRDRLTRAEGQMKTGVDRVSKLEADLKQARSQTWTLERTVQQLHEQNEKLQSDFDKELNKLTESIRENTAHLEDIAKAREKLQVEKEDLEKRLVELSEHYNKSLKNVEHEMNVNVSKFIETEKKYAEDLQVKKKLETKTESLCAQLLETELRCKDISKQLQEKELQLSKAVNYHKELDIAKKELDIINLKNEEYRNHLVKQDESIKDLEKKIEEAINLNTNMKSDLENKEEYIKELEKQQSLLEQQLQESETKMESYEKQLVGLKNHIAQLQVDFGEFENLEGLREMITQQQSKLLEITRQNGELAKALQNKEIEMEGHLQNLSEQEQILEQKEEILKMLSEKEEEHSNIIKLLRNNLEIRSQADAVLNQQVLENNAEINSLIANVETRKKQISQLEKIILTLEEQMRQANSQRIKDRDNITLLEKKIAEFEAYHLVNKQSKEGPNENLDNLIKILENELETSYESPLNPNNNQYIVSKKKQAGDQKREKLSKFDRHSRNVGSFLIQPEHESIPTKIVMGNYVKKTYAPTNDEQFKGDNLDRKKALTKIETQKWSSVPEAGINFYATSRGDVDNFSGLKEYNVPISPHDDVLKQNLQYFNLQKLRNDRKCKMFKIAGHRL